MYLAKYTTDYGKTYKYIMVRADNVTLAIVYIYIDIDPVGGFITEIEKI